MNNEQLKVAAYNLGAKGAPATQYERELFEEWMRGHCWHIGPWVDENGDGYYYEMSTRVAWAAWRDRAALSSAQQDELEYLRSAFTLQPEDEASFPNDYAVVRAERYWELRKIEALCEQQGKQELRA